MSTTLCQNRAAVGRAGRDLQFVSFTLGEQVYAVDVVDVYGIYHGLPLIPNPDSPVYLDGEVQIANRRIPVVNLRRFAGMTDSTAEKTPRWILMINQPGGPVGLIVDRVSEVVRLTPACLIEPEATDQSPVGGYVNAMANHQGRCMWLPDMNRLLRDAVN